MYADMPILMRYKLIDAHHIHRCNILHSFTAAAVAGVSAPLDGQIRRAARAQCGQRLVQVRRLVAGTQNRRGYRGCVTAVAATASW